MKVKKAVILAAGRGTRFLPYTKAVCKELIAVTDRPAIYLVVEEIINSGITDICIVISHEKEDVKKYFEPDKALCDFLLSRGKQKEYELVTKLSNIAHFTYVYQPYANGSAGALNCAREFCASSPVAVLNADDAVYCEEIPATKQLCDCFEQYEKSILGVQEVARDAIGKYASCDVVKTLSNGTHLLRDVIEKPSDNQVKTLLAPLGRYVIDGGFFDVLDRTPIAKNGEWQFTDALQLQAKTQGIIAYEFLGKRYDLGDKLGYLKAVVEYSLRDQTLGAPFASYLKALSADLTK